MSWVYSLGISGGNIPPKKTEAKTKALTHEIAALQILVKARLRQGIGMPQGSLENKVPRPRPHTCIIIKYTRI